MPLHPRITLAGALLLLLLPLAGCQLDSEEDLRSELSQWLTPVETKHFLSKSSCTVGIFRVKTPDVALENGMERAFNAEAALELVEAGSPVLFEFAGKSPTEVSEALMTADLARGLGLLSSGIGPVLSCAQEDKLRQGIYRMLIYRGTKLIYLPSGNAMVLVYPPEKLAVFMRGNV